MGLGIEKTMVKRAEVDYDDETRLMVHRLGDHDDRSSPAWVSVGGVKVWQHCWGTSHRVTKCGKIRVAKKQTFDHHLVFKFLR